MDVQDHYYRLTKGGSRDVAPGTIFYDFYDLETLWFLTGNGSTPEVLLAAVSNAAEHYDCVPNGMKLKLAEDNRGGKTDLMIVFAEDAD